jgi:hypothetical protein
MKGAGLLPARSRRKRKPQPGGIPARDFRGIGNLVLGGRYIKATVGRVARHVPICRGELLSTLTPGRSAYCHAKGKTPAKASEAAGALEASAAW